MTVTNQSYVRPLITEIYSEVHFEPGSFPPERFFDIVPLLKPLGFEDVQFGRTDVVDADGEYLMPQQTNSLRVRCWSGDKYRLIQLVEDMIAVNLVGPYPGWAAYREVFANVRSVVVEGLGLLPVESLSLNTVDQLVAPKAGFKLGRYLHCGGPAIPTSCENFSTAFDVTTGVGLLHDDGFNRQIRITGRPVGDRFAVFINAIFHNRFERGRDLVGLLDQLHEESVETFESMMTDFTRHEVMGGSKDVVSS